MSNDEKIYQKMLKAIVEHQLPQAKDCQKINFQKRSV